MAAHKHAEVIKAWADGLPIQYKSCGMWEDFDSEYDPNWKSKIIQWRVKPAEPERVYPVTQMTGSEVYKIAQDAADRTAVSRPLLAVANAALRHACDNGQVVPREEFDRAVGDRKARDMAVAHAAIRRVNLWLDCDRRLSGLPKIQVASGDSDIAAILSEVRP